MIFDRTDEHPGARLLLVGASVVVVVAGLKVAAPILLPFALGVHACSPGSIQPRQAGR